MFPFHVSGSPRGGPDAGVWNPAMLDFCGSRMPPRMGIPPNDVFNWVFPLQMTYHVVGFSYVDCPRFLYSRFSDWFPCAVHNPQPTTMSGNIIILSHDKMEQLIDLVRQNPGLYDQSTPQYQDQIWARNVWQKIGAKIGAFSSSSSASVGLVWWRLSTDLLDHPPSPAEATAPCIHRKTSSNVYDLQWLGAGIPLAVKRMPPRTYGKALSARWPGSGSPCGGKTRTWKAGLKGNIHPGRDRLHF